LISCSGNQKTSDDGYYFQDFDNLKMWDNNARVTNEEAHSGHFSVFTDSLNEFSQTFEINYDDVIKKGYKKIAVSAWSMKKTYDAYGTLVISIESPEKKIAYASFELIKVLKKPSAWYPVSIDLNLPQQSPPNTKIKVYLWSPKKEKIYMDDTRIVFTK
jgi:hypothetical protein